MQHFFCQILKCGTHGKLFKKICGWKTNENLCQPVRANSFFYYNIFYLKPLEPIVIQFDLTLGHCCVIWNIDVPQMIKRFRVVYFRHDGINSSYNAHTRACPKTIVFFLLILNFKFVVLWYGVCGWVSCGRMSVNHFKVGHGKLVF